MKLTTQITGSTPFFYFLEAIDSIAKKNWFESDAGSMSMIMDMEDIWPYVADGYNPCEYRLKVAVPKLSDQFILITGDQVPLRNVAKFKFKIHRMLGIIQINYAGDGYKIVWGFQDGCQPTRFLNNHLLIHNERLKTNIKHRVLMHTFPNNLVQKTYVDKIENEYQFTYDIWNAMPAFARWAPEGIGLMSPEHIYSLKTTQVIAEKFRQFRLIVLKYQGVIISGENCDEVVTLSESLDKAASNSMKIINEPKYVIKPAFLRTLVKKDGLILNPLVLKYGNLTKTQIFPPEVTESSFSDAGSDKNEESDSTSETMIVEIQESEK